MNLFSFELDLPNSNKYIKPLKKKQMAEIFSINPSSIVNFSDCLGLRKNSIIIGKINNRQTKDILKYFIGGINIIVITLLCIY